ncbi:MAG: ATP-binding protein [Polyangiales bacterium]
MIDQAASLAVLDQELRRVALRSLRAIARAWDTRRLGYGNEGRHPYEHEVAALLGMNAGFANDYVLAADEHLADHAAAAPVAARRAGTTPLGAIAAELGLSELATEILMVVAAPALWSEAARLYGILANDAGRPVIDEALVEQLLGADVSRHALAAELDTRAPLVRLGVIDIDARRPRPFSALTVDPVILARLRREEPDLGPGLAAHGSDRAYQELALGPDVLPAAITGLAQAKLPARIALRGRPGSGRRTLLASLAAEGHRALGILDVAQLPRTEPELVTAVRLGLRRAQLAGLFPCVVGIETIAFADRTGREVIADVVRAHPGPLAVVLPPEEAAPFGADHVSIDLPVLAEGERLAVWTRALADASLEVADRDALAARYRIGPGMIHRAVAAVGAQGAGDATPAIDRYIRQARDARLGAYARRVDKLASWDQIVLPSDIEDSLRELVARVRFGRTVYETWGMAQTMATSRGLTALFSGPPGTGKTLVAGVIARELGLDLYQVDLSKVMSKWIGETERNLGAIFDAAEDGQVILLFDEADSLFAKRTEVRSSNDRYANLEVNYLLQRLDAFTGIAVLTTNASGSIDPAFKRRLSFRLSFPFPDEDTRELLWRAHLPPTLPIDGELALDRLAHKYQLSGGYIRNACLRAAFLAAQDGAGLAQHHLERAVALEFAELGKLSNSGSLD